MRILFAGTSDIGEKVFEMLLEKHEVVGVLTQPDRPAGRHRELQPSPIKKLAQRLAPEAPLLQPEKLRDASTLASLQALAPEVIVTISYGKILPPEILALPKIACLNIHASLLPRYRGASPIQAALLAGDRESGVTIMYMAEGLDTGDILLTKKITLHSQETTESLTERLSLLAPEALTEALMLLEQGDAPRIPQDETLATATHRIERSDAFLDWTQPAVQLERLIRAMNPKPGAHGIIQLAPEKTISLKVFSATVINEEQILQESLNQQPGSFFFSDNGVLSELAADDAKQGVDGAQQRSVYGNTRAASTGATQLCASAVELCKKSNQTILLRTGQGALLLHEVQPEGRPRMSFEAFARGQQLLLKK